MDDVNVGSGQVCSLHNLNIIRHKLFQDILFTTSPVTENVKKIVLKTSKCVI